MDAPMEIALWRYQVIAPLLALDGGRGSLKRALDRIAAQEHEHPQRGKIRVGRGTVETWLYAYRKGGLDALKDRPRRDQGVSRAIDDDLAERIETLARRYPDLDGPGILAELGADRFFPVETLPSLSSLYRFLKARGLDQRRAPRHRDHRAFIFDLAGDCWQCDVMYGPSLPTRQGTRRKTYLFAVLDDATRLIAHAQFYFEQHLRSLKDCLRQAFQKRGLPRRLYVDQARIFKSRLILLIGARLGIHLIHTRPYQPQGRAKLERWFRTVRRSFLARVVPDRLEGIEELNRLLWAWVEGVYHPRPHRGLAGQSPLDRWLALSEGLRPLPGDVDLDRLFLEQTTRDPFDLRKVIVEGPQGEDGDAFPVDRVANRTVRRNPPPQDPAGHENAPPLRSLSDLADRLAKEGEPEEDKEPSHEE
jgi:transposase InsO family protein